MADSKKQVQEMVKLFEKMTKNSDSSKKSIRELGDAIADVSEAMKEINKELNKNTSHFKEFSKLTDTYGKLDKQLSGLSRELDNLGVVASDGFFNLEKGVDDAKKSLLALGQETEKLTKNQLGFAKIPQSISKIKKSFESAFKGGNKNLGAFKKEMESLNFKKLSDNFKDDNEQAFKEVAKSLLEDFDFDNLLDFGDLDEESKKIVENLKRIKETGGDSVQDVIDGINDLEASQEVFNKTIGTAQSKLKSLSDSAEEDFKRMQNALMKFQQRFDISKVVQNNMLDIQSTISDMISGVNQKANDLRVLPSDLGAEFKGAQVLSEQLASGLGRIQELTQKLADQDLGADEKENIIKLQEIELKNIWAIDEAIKEKLENTNMYLDAIEKTSVMNWGVDKLNKVKSNIFQVSVVFQKMAKDGDSAFSKTFDSLSKKFKGLGEYMTKFKFAAGMIAGAYTLIKATAGIEQQAGKTFRSVTEAGIGVGEGAETIGATIKDAAHETLNLGGLIKSATPFMKDGFALSQEEILGVVGGLNQAGLSASKLKEQMGPVMGSFSETKSEMIAAASMVKVFSSSLGMADSEITSLMGNMTNEFNSTMGSMQEGLTAITNAQQKSGMSGVKFMGILSTTTAGLAIYEDQITSTAEAISKLAQNTSMSGKSIENFARSALEASQDTSGMMTTLSLMGQGGMDALKVTLEEDLAKLKEKEKATTDPKLKEQIQGQIYWTEQSVKALQESNIPDLAANMKKLDPEASMKATAIAMMKTLESSGGGGLEREALMNAIGQNKAFESLRGLSPEAQMKALKEIAEGKDKGGDKSTKDLKDAAMEKDKLTGDALNKAMLAAQEKASLYLFNIQGVLVAISAMMAAQGGYDAAKNMLKDFWSKGKDFFGKKGGGGGGPTGPGKFGNSTFTKYGGAGGGKLSPSWRGPVGGGGAGGGTAGAAGGSGPNFLSKLGEKFKGGGALANLGKGLKGLGAFKGLAKFAVGANPIGKALTMGTSLVSGFMNAGDIAGKDESQLTFGDKAQAGISSALSDLTFGLVDSQSIFKGIDAINPFANTPNAPGSVNIPGAVANKATGVGSTSTEAGGPKNPGAGGMVVNIHVNGNDENRLRKVIMSTIKDYEDMKKG
jgi:hypothetical protein